MAGAWEEGGSVLVSILTRELVATQWAWGFRNLSVPGGIQFLSGMTFDNARNQACRAVLEHRYDWLFFLDDDVIAPPDTIPRLMAHGKDIVSGIYYRRKPPLNPVMLRYSGPDKVGTTYVTNYKWPDLIEVDLVGAGCLLIHRRVLETMLAENPAAINPWFEWMCDRTDLPPHERKSEDFEFCVRAQKKGFKIHVDTSILCKHVGLGKAWVNGSNPEFSPLDAEAS